MVNTPGVSTARMGDGSECGGSQVDTLLTWAAFVQTRLSAPWSRVVRTGRVGQIAGWIWQHFLGFLSPALMQPDRVPCHRRVFGAKTARAPRAACRTQSSASSTRCGVSAMPGTQYSVCISALEHERCNCESLGYEQGGGVDRCGWDSEWLMIKVGDDDYFSLKP